MAKRKKSLRDELLEARAKILRQIEICENNPVSNLWTAGGGEAPAPTPVAELESTLEEIDEAISNLGDDDA